MKKESMKKTISLLLITLFFISVTCSVYASHGSNDVQTKDNVSITVEINRIRCFETIDFFSDPDFYVKIFINENEFQSPIWKNSRYIDDVGWSATCMVPDYVEWVDIRIQLWDWNIFLRDKLCDLDGNSGSTQNNHEVNLFYSLKTGHWTGDDQIGDPSGYGRLNGCDDGSLYTKDQDCELWFDIYQIDNDGDGIPQWIEENIYHTSPAVNDAYIDPDNDNIPLWWEWKWGYNPFVYDDHDTLDPDNDGIENIEEFITNEWVYSDPFRKDLFVEMDLMEEGPNGEQTVFPYGSVELLRDAYHKHNWMYHFDDGDIGEGGGELIPFDEETNDSELGDIYNEYFLHGNESFWRRGIFHYGLFIYNYHLHGGNAFGTNAFQISSNYLEDKVKIPHLKRDIVYASAFMHETGHTLGIFHFNTPGCDDQMSKFPYQKNFWMWRPYKSVMNYGYMYKMVDYSDGSHGQNDFDDWNRMDLTFFQNGEW